ncbi:MAG: hypothetical protein GYA21_08575 [Myxococcales bacterium]|nr:hypothetical protein [Myxococcales bacterium]
MKPVRKLAALLVLSSALMMAQRKVNLHNMYERVICVVPMVGKGTADDPRRPMFAPLPGKEGPRADGIMAWSFVLSDDGNMAVVEFVARDRSAFKEILNAGRADVRSFRKGHDQRDDIEQEFRKHRKNFSMDELRTVTR